MDEDPEEKKSSKRDNSKDISEIIDLIAEKSPKTLVKTPETKPPEPTKKEIDTSLVKIIRAYDYVGGAIRFKIAVQNISDTVLTDVNITLIPAEQYEILERIKDIAILKPNESRGVDFELIPSTCGKSKLFGSCTFIDPYGNPHSLAIPPKEIWIKCPLVEPRKSTISEIESLKKDLKKGTAKIPFTIDENSAFDLMIGQISALDLSEVVVGKLMGLYSGIAKVTNDLMIIESKVDKKNAYLTVWTKDLKQATGFLAYLKNLINIAFETALKIEGKIEKISQKILDSNEIIQRFNSLFNYCEEQWTIGEIIILVKEIKSKMEKAFPESSIIEKLKNLIEELENIYQEETIISEKMSIEIEFKILNWLSELNQVACNNLITYEQAFPEQKTQIKQCNELIEEKYLLIELCEKKYNEKILQYLMVINKNSGLSLYEHNFKEKALNPNLVSGLLTGIQSFGSELANEETSMTRLAYKNFEIAIEERDKVRGSLILKGSPTESITKTLKLFTLKFELKFKNELENWKGNVTIFGTASELIKEIFG